MSACELCVPGAGEPVFETDSCRVVLVGDPGFPGFCRVIAKRHVREMSDLAAEERRAIMDLVFAVEAAVRQLVKPHKMNLASLGNVTPHLHWHVIPRWTEDPRFPQPIWGEPLREGAAPPAPEGLAAALRAALDAAFPPPAAARPSESPS
jgi:diadenosine tetraphosphate (Ap4A) HIT family hydrolase